MGFEEFSKFKREMSTQKKRNFQIEAFKRRIVADPKYAEKIWNILEYMQSMRYAITMTVGLVSKNCTGMLTIKRCTNLRRNFALD